MKLREAILEAKLDADRNERYWKYLTPRYARREKVLKILLAFVSVGTVAGWGFLDTSLSKIWQGISIFSAIIAVTLPILDYQKKIEDMSYLVAKWGELKIEYGKLWLEIESGSDTYSLQNSDLLIERYTKLRRTEAILGEKESKLLPRNKKLLDKCYNEVKSSITSNYGD